VTVAVPVIVTSRPRTSTAPTALVFRRLRLDMHALGEAGLGGRLFGSVKSSPLPHVAAAGMAVLPMELLAPEGMVLDAWSGGAECVMREHGCVRYATDGHWLHGCAEVDEAQCQGGLQSASQRAYADLFAVLAASASPHLLRLWNHFADMNLETGGIERYRQFNAGRQQAFTEAGRSAFEGAPAACALGTASGPLRVYFLAGPQAPLAIENPRQVSAYHYPERYGPRSPTFSRAALVGAGRGHRMLFISGTASIIGHVTVHVGDVWRQTEESLANIAALLDVAASPARMAVPLQDLIFTIYLRHASDLGAVRDVFERQVGAHSAAARDAVYLRADICRADLLVEIEAHGHVRAPSRTADPS
jgi:enamine deaminase RidA (YjgF/YER057c/UK114 family)